ncbi:hypothetical protein HDU92_006663 [Lobulomyces angularis]|nr:hypothetical protein HDU92_006663 [Lobulomyces angularis]
MSFADELSTFIENHLSVIRTSLFLTTATSAFLLLKTSTKFGRTLTPKKPFPDYLLSGKRSLSGIFQCFQSNVILSSEKRKAETIEIMFQHIPVFQRVVFGLPRKVDKEKAFRIKLVGYEIPETSNDPLINSIDNKCGKIIPLKFDCTNSFLYGIIKTKKNSYSPFYSIPTLELLKKGLISFDVSQSTMSELNLLNKKFIASNLKFQEYAKKKKIGIWKDAVSEKKTELTINYLKNFFKKIKVVIAGDLISTFAEPLLVQCGGGNLLHV